MTGDWDKYCLIPKSARQLLQEETPKVEESSPEASTEDYQEKVLRVLSDYEQSVRVALEASQKYLEVLSSLDNSRNQILNQTSELSKKSDSLLKERNEYVALSSELRSKVFYYNQYDSLDAEVELMANDFLQLRKKLLQALAQICDAVEFFRENPHYQQSWEFLEKYTSLKFYLLERFVGALSEQFQLFYTEPEKLYSKMPNWEELAHILEQLYEKVDPDYSDFLLQLGNQYFSTRKKHIYNLVTKHYYEASKETNVVSLVRKVCEFCSKLWRKEKTLFLTYFKNSKDLKETLQKQLDYYTRDLYEVARALIISEHNSDTLCDLAEIVKNEFRGEELKIFSKMYQDVQERIIYSVQSFIPENIVPLKHTQEEHPALRATISLLTKLSGRVEGDIFLGLAEEAISTCIGALKQSMPEEDFLEGHSFLIKHIEVLRQELLVICEHLNMNFTTKVLDFSNTKQLFWRLISGQVALYKEGMLADLVNTGAPKFQEKSQDIRSVIQSELRKACQSLVLKVFHEVANPAVVFLFKTKTATLPYEEAEQALTEGSNKITQVFPRFRETMSQVLDEKNYKEVINSASVQVMKAYRQLLSYMERAYPTKPLPSILHIQTLLQFN